MSKGRCKFYNNQWHMHIHDMLTGSNFKHVIPPHIASKVVTAGAAEDVICPYGTSNVPVMLTRLQPTGIQWRIIKQGSSNWEDYRVLRKLKKSAELVSFTK